MSASNPFGVLDFLSWDHDWNGHHYPLHDVRQSSRLMRDAGVGCARMDFFWADLEPAPRQFDFARYDALVECLTGEGLEILGLLHYNPAWRPVLWNSSPIPADFERYARAVVRHFAGSVHYWEVWNEPDHPTYWQPQDELGAYSRLLKRIYPVVKEADPRCKVLMGGLTTELSKNLGRLYEQAGADNFDIVNIHPFVSPLAHDAIEDLRRRVDDTRSAMERHGDESKPIWITEIGCPGSRENLTWWLGKNPTEAQQADWTTAVYTAAPRWKGVEKVFWAFFRDTQGHFKDAVDHFGLIRRDFTAKPAYGAYQAMAVMKR